MHCRAKLPVYLLTIAVLAIMAPPVLASGKTGDARTLFTEVHKCDLCHAVPAAGIDARSKSTEKQGPDLGGQVGGGVKEIRAHLGKGPERGNDQGREGFKGSDEELQALVDWLGSLELEK